jgi:hypothetical protein
VDFLQFINHIQKKITGKNRVHGIGQGHNSAGTSANSDGTAPLGYFNADMVDGLHARGTDVDLSSAYIPVANGAANPNLAAAFLKETYTQGNSSVLHELVMNNSDSGLRRVEGGELKWRINSYARSKAIWVSDSTSPETKLLIEPYTHNAVFMGNSVGIRGWSATKQGALYFGARADGGLSTWVYKTEGSNDNPLYNQIIDTDGKIVGSSIATNSITQDKLSGQIPANKVDGIPNIHYITFVFNTGSANIPMRFKLPFRTDHIISIITHSGGPNKGFAEQSVKDFREVVINSPSESYQTSFGNNVSMELEPIMHPFKHDSGTSRWGKQISPNDSYYNVIDGQEVLVGDLNYNLIAGKDYFEEGYAARVTILYWS